MGGMRGEPVWAGEHFSCFGRSQVSRVRTAEVGAMAGQQQSVGDGIDELGESREVGSMVGVPVGRVGE